MSAQYAKQKKLLFLLGVFARYSPEVTIPAHVKSCQSSKALFVCFYCFVAKEQQVVHLKKALYSFKSTRFNLLFFKNMLPAFKDPFRLHYVVCRSLK